MELNYAQALRDEAAGLERRIGAMARTGVDTTLLERRIASIRSLLGEPTPEPEAKRNGKPRGRETRPAGTGDTPEA